MQVLFDDDLVEAGIALGTTGRLAGLPDGQLRRFHAQREPCYEIPDPDQQSAAFARVHQEWFTAWGLRRRLEEPVSAFPVLPDALVALVFRRSRGRHDEGAELYLDEQGSRRGVVALRPDRLAAPPVLTRFLHHELAHLADMVSPAFGYSADLAHTGHTPSQLRLVRERYRLLWAISIDGRLAARDLPGQAGAAHRRAEFDRAFAFLSLERRAEVFAGLWDGRMATHQDLLALASDPRELHGCHDPIPGAACPLCGFAAFSWAGSGDLRPDALARVQAEFPSWHPDEPICARCAEIYNAVSGLEYPATVCL